MTACSACYSLPLSSRAVGFRFGTHLDRAVPLAMDYCNTSGEEDYEIKEYCLQVGGLNRLLPPLALEFPTCCSGGG